MFVERGDIQSSMLLPCGRCQGCRLERSLSWSVRIMHEAQGHKDSAFVTLTYSESAVPVSLVYRDFQLFMKRLRKKHAVWDVELGCWVPRFFMCGEYGEYLGRPHFHCGLFGVGFRADRYRWRVSEAGFPVFRSPSLERLWPHGNSELGELTAESAAYMARYTFKKVTGDLAEGHYQGREPEFAHMSLKPGLGQMWFSRYMQDVRVRDAVVVDGQQRKVPRYYDKLLKRIDAQALEEVQQDRILKAVDRGFQDVTPERLAVRERVTAARMRFYKRS